VLLIFFSLLGLTFTAEKQLRQSEPNKKVQYMSIDQLQESKKNHTPAISNFLLCSLSWTFPSTMRLTGLITRNVVSTLSLLVQLHHIKN
jgi:hypothetical protein